MVLDSMMLRRAGRVPAFGHALHKMFCDDETIQKPKLIVSAQLPSERLFGEDGSFDAADYANQRANLRTCESIHEQRCAHYSWISSSRLCNGLLAVDFAPKLRPRDLFVDHPAIIRSPRLYQEQGFDYSADILVPSPRSSRCNPVHNLLRQWSKQ